MLQFSREHHILHWTRPNANDLMLCQSAIYQLCMFILVSETYWFLHSGFSEKKASPELILYESTLTAQDVELLELYTVVSSINPSTGIWWYFFPPIKLS